MRILKYIFLLIILIVIAVTVYVATQKGTFSVTKSVIISVSRPVVFNYVNDYRNWEQWESRKKDNPGMEFTYSENSIGKGAYYTWGNNSDDGKVQTIFVKQNDSIAQQITYSGQKSRAYLTFRDTLGKTKVIWHYEGKVDFMTKVHATFSGGVSKMMEDVFERSLANLKSVITNEINTYNIQPIGIIRVPGTYYIKQSTRCMLSDAPSRIMAMLPRMVAFFRKNKMTMTGKPFAIYENDISPFVRISVCAPVGEEIFISPGSDMSTGLMESFSALKTTLKGDYSHLEEARRKASAYVSENNITTVAAIKRIDIFTASVPDVKRPSQWLTEIMIPVQSATEPTPVVAPLTSTPVTEKPAELPVQEP